MALRIMNIEHNSQFYSNKKKNEARNKLQLYKTDTQGIINNPLKTKRRLLYLKTQSVPRCKHFSSRL